MSITFSDLKLVVRACRGWQDSTTKEAISQFALAYGVAKRVAKRGEFLISADRLEDLVQVLAGIIDPRNQSGYRSSQDNSGDPMLETNIVHLPLAIESLYRVVAARKMSAIEAYERFRAIRPFPHGNRRLGHLIWAGVTNDETGTWPNSLPPRLFAG